MARPRPVTLVLEVREHVREDAARHSIEDAEILHADRESLLQRQHALLQLQRHMRRLPKSRKVCTFVHRQLGHLTSECELSRGRLGTLPHEMVMHHLYIRWIDEPHCSTAVLVQDAWLRLLRGLPRCLVLETHLLELVLWKYTRVQQAHRDAAVSFGSRPVPVLGLDVVLYHDRLRVLSGAVARLWGLEGVWSDRSTGGCSRRECGALPSEAFHELLGDTHDALQGVGARMGSEALHRHVVLLTLAGRSKSNNFHHMNKTQVGQRDRRWVVRDQVHPRQAAGVIHEEDINLASLQGSLGADAQSAVVQVYHCTPLVAVGSELWRHVHDTAGPLLHVGVGGEVEETVEHGQAKRGDVGGWSVESGCPVEEGQPGAQVDELVCMEAHPVHMQRDVHRCQCQLHQDAVAITPTIAEVEDWMNHGALCVWSLHGSKQGSGDLLHQLGLPTQCNTKILTKAAKLQIPNALEANLNWVELDAQLVPPLFLVHVHLDDEAPKPHVGSVDLCTRCGVGVGIALKGRPGSSKDGNGLLQVSQGCGVQAHMHVAHLHLPLLGGLCSNVV
mmetsp:Transcript_50437/g.134055  ORF Transcript_50437/g.134055 Transcript_50437/m.134055 type:complete len:559 (-) Transcript_50437:2471-4147(-)